MLVVTQLLYVHDGAEPIFEQFERIVLPLLAKYRGELLLRLRPTPSTLVDGTLALPYEVHVVQFASEADLEAYAADEVRQDALHLKEQAVSRTLAFTAR
jgi:hypothetical protein